MQHAKIERADPGISLGKLANDAEVRARFISLAKSQRRLSWDARKSALEAQAAGDALNFQHYRAKAVKLWRDALDHLEHARRWSPK
jgi:hypothetical protein